MQISDKPNFAKLMNDLCDYYRADHMSETMLRVYFGALERFEFDDVCTASSKHLADTKSGQFMPKVADFVKHIEGGPITADAIIAAARLKKTPLGCLARIQIGSFDLGSEDAFYLKQRAEECLQLLPEWKARAENGDYTDHEISVMLKFDVNPTAPLAIGMAPPANPIGLLDRTTRIKASPKHLLTLEKLETEEERAERKKDEKQVLDRVPWEPEEEIN